MLHLCFCNYYCQKKSGPNSKFYYNRTVGEQLYGRINKPQLLITTELIDVGFNSIETDVSPTISFIFLAVFSGL